MKKLIISILILLSIAADAQDYITIDKMQSTTLVNAKVLTNELVNLGSKKFEFYKEKDTSEFYIFIYIPTGLTPDQKEEIRINHYEEGVIFRLSKNNNQTYKLSEFYASPDLMTAIVNKVFYPGITLEDFTKNSKYWDFIKPDKGLKFYFYHVENEYRFYQY